ncbi:glycosyltransferase family 2 protein [Patescibacteria group bacterium]|nr:glycosyltransferase family 2 protein [Desulfobacteraceae bacterium]MBU4027164.1 glycosyltransferase family 2 protein [Patescibacteria group bacterium]MBU4069280.1 glycosyltransferase family 2 protein [Pseudomonadota bacterium]
MKYSVLLPTRNGGPFLADCISSILDQPYHDMELVVSDNANTDETQEVVASFAKDSRLKVIRVDTPISVTDNWNRAFDASSGDYILMMGDDDYLLPGYFQRVDQILEKYGNPECITYNVYVYISSSAIMGNSKSYYNNCLFKYGPDMRREGLLSRKMRLGIVKDMYNFRVRIQLNMQPHLISRKATKRIVGKVFQPPYPDHYALNSLLLTAKDWVYVPEKLLVLGVSPKSYGHFVYSNDIQDEGQSYLGIASDFEGRLPGNELLNSMHVWLELIKSKYKAVLKDIKISRAPYVRRQVYFWYVQYKFGALSFKDVLSNARKLSLGDWFGLFPAFFDKAIWILVWSLLRFSKSNKIETFYGDGAKPLDNISNIREFADSILDGKLTGN